MIVKKVNLLELYKPSSYTGIVYGEEEIVNALNRQSNLVLGTAKQVTTEILLSTVEAVIENIIIENSILIGDIVFIKENEALFNDLKDGKVNLVLNTTAIINDINEVTDIGYISFYFTYME